MSYKELKKKTLEEIIVYSESIGLNIESTNKNDALKEFTAFKRDQEEVNTELPSVLLKDSFTKRDYDELCIMYAEKCGKRNANYNSYGLKMMVTALIEYYGK